MAESYLHFHAKTDFASWLRKMKGKNFKGLNNITFKCKDKGSSPMFNVYTEFPVCKDKATKKIIGSDISWSDYFAKSNKKAKQKHGIPAKWELKEWENDLIILHIFDIAVIDENKISHIFEIKHTHAVDNKKIKFVEKHQIPMWEISAQWVIEKVKGKIPWDLEYLQCFCADHLCSAQPTQKSSGGSSSIEQPSSDSSSTKSPNVNASHPNDA